MPGLLVSPAREALKEGRRLEARVERLEAELIAVKEAAHAQANATNTAIMRLEQSLRRFEPVGRKVP